MPTQVREYVTEIDDDNCSATTSYPGTTYNDFDRAGSISPMKICVMFEAGRQKAMCQCNFLNYNDLEMYGFTVLGGELYFDSCLWEIPHRYNYFPYRIRVELVNVGRTSVTLRLVLINSLDNKELAWYFGTMVYVDRTMRCSRPLPDWFTKKYRVKEAGRKVEVDRSDWSVPSSAYKVKRVVQASDTGDLGHTNLASYIRYCMDAAASIIKGKNSAFTHFTLDICLYPVVKMTRALHIETFTGYELVTSVWEDGLSPQILHFTIHSGDKLVLTSSIEFNTVPCSKESKL